MVKGISCVNPLTIDERRIIQEGLSAGLCYRLIAEELGRCKSVVRLESLRLGPRENYDADKAQAHADLVQYNHGFRVWRRARDKRARDKRESLN